MSTFGVIKDISATLRNWSVGLKQLTFTDNMRCIARRQEVIPPKKTKPVRHGLGKIPQDVLFSNVKNGILDMESKDAEYVYVRNRSAATEDCTVDVLIFP